MYTRYSFCIVCTLCKLLNYTFVISLPPVLSLIIETMEITPFAEMNVEELMSYSPMDILSFWRMDTDPATRQGLPRRRGYVFEPKIGMMHIVQKRPRQKRRRLDVVERFLWMCNRLYCRDLPNCVSKFAKPMLLTLVRRDRNNRLFMLPRHLLLEILKFLQDLTLFIKF